MRGEFEAGSKSEVIDHIEKKGLIPLNVEERSFALRRARGFSIKPKIFETITPLDRILFVRNLAASIQAGLNIIEAIDILLADTVKPLMRSIISQAKTNLQNGQPLSQTFSAYKKHFPLVFVGMLKAGEASGKLDKTLEELATHLTREYNLSKKVKSALSYPILLLIASIFVVGLLIIFVIPRLAKAFKQSGVELPFITKMLVGLSNILSYSPLLDLIVVALLTGGIIYAGKTERGRKFFMRMISHIPVAHELMQKIALIRITRTLGNLINSGTPIIEALKLSAESAGNDYYREALIVSIEQAKNGIPFSKTLESYPHLFPHFLTGLVTVGERTGTLEHILKTFSDFYDEDVDNTLKDLTNFIEPVLLLFMGLVIGAVAFSILLPIYQLIGKFS